MRVRGLPYATRIGVPNLPSCRQPELLQQDPGILSSLASMRGALPDPPTLESPDPWRCYVNAPYSPCRELGRCDRRRRSEQLHNTNSCHIFKHESWENL